MTQGSGRKSPIFLIGLLIVAGMAIIGWGSPAPSACNPKTIGTSACGVPSCIDNSGPICQTGTVTFTLSATNTNTQTITFSPAFSATPRFFNLYPPASWPSVTVATSGAATTEYCFICPDDPTSTFTWTSMPAVLTELFGDLNKQHQILTVSGGWASTSFTVAVDCITGSTAASPILRVQWSTDDATWNDLANTAGQADLPVDNFVGCPGAGTIISKQAITVSSSFPAAGTVVYFRVVGVGGGGVGDNPQFSWIRLTFQTAAKTAGLFCIFTKTAISATTATVKLTCPAVTTLTSIFNWYAEK